MKAEEFIVELERCQPPREELIRQECPIDLIDEIRARYICPLRSKPLAGPNDDPLICLINQYDVSNLEIGFVRFRSIIEWLELLERGPCAVIASVDADLIASSPVSGEVLLVDGCNPNTVMLRVAKDGGRFLDALIEMINGRKKGDDAESITMRCAEKAAADGSHRFFQMQLVAT